MKLVYTVNAVEDLARLREFIEVDNPLVAQRISTELLEGIETLIEHPKIGRPVSKAPDPEIIRDLIRSDYIIRYIFHKDRIAILRIWRHRENEP